MPFPPLLGRPGPLARVALLACAAGCSDGYVDGEVWFRVNGENATYFEDVLYPRQAAGRWTEILSPRNAYVDFKVSYRTEDVSALITQEGDLQITAHLKAGERYRALSEEGELGETYEYLLGEEYNAGQGEEEGEPYRIGSDLYAEVVDRPDDTYFEVDQDVRLVLVVNLPSDAEVLEKEWRDESHYPKDLRANYLHTDEDGVRLPTEEVELAAFLIVGRQTFQADFDPSSDHVDLVLERFVHPDDQGDAGDPQTRGTLDMHFTDPTLEVIGAEASITADFTVVPRIDAWALPQPEPAEEIGAEQG